ncbi:diacylglycerol kinase family protein [Kocuria sp.]|uniref:diacylglycerol/lipid kinase family protein n=1 Tax=Kocuria sp. TaxID=1871328 RepID=UPI0026DAF5B0|nr:diacylglycerol kinase family protein [Kocuria sp.]MDO4918602.1 diacylglycerol kinase family protein [Kocuria sp.]
MTTRTTPEVLLVHSAASAAARDACHRAAGIVRAGGCRPVPLAADTAARLADEVTSHLRAHPLTTAAVVAVGGDGTAHLVLQCLRTLAGQGVEFPLGLVPAGSGNDLARFHGVPTHDPEQAAGRVLRGLESPPRRTDLLHVRCADGSEHVCTTAVCLGLDARINARANGWPRVRSSAKYAVALVLETAALRARRYDLSWTAPDGTGRAEQRELTFLCVANTSSIGGGLGIVPRADAADGVAELFTVSDVGPARLLGALPRLWRRTHEALPEVAVEPAVRATVALAGAASAHPVRDAAHGDGERLGPLPVSLRLLPGAQLVLF